MKRVSLVFCFFFGVLAILSGVPTAAYADQSVTTTLTCNFTTYGSDGNLQSVPSATRCPVVAIFSIGGTAYYRPISCKIRRRSSSCVTTKTFTLPDGTIDSRRAFSIPTVPSDKCTFADQGSAIGDGAAFEGDYLTTSSIVAAFTLACAR